MCIYMKKDHAKLHPDQIENDGDLGFLNSVPNNKKRNNNNKKKISINRDMGSVGTYPKTSRNF